MIARKVTLSTLETAAAGLGMRLLDCNPRGRGFRFQLRPAGARGKYGRLSASWSRNKNGERRRVSAICWHGFRDFFRAVYAVTPDAIFRTSFANYLGASDFENKFPETYYHEAGSMMAPVSFGELCECGENV